MSLTLGAHLGPYEISAPIGAGGMGEVFRARDMKLNRDVAIKVLPAAFADDPERLARFTREAQTLASLNHPNIAHVYSFEQLPAAADGSRPRSDASVEGRPRGSESPGGEQDVAPAGAQGLSREATIAFLVMEFVEGEDLSERLKRGAIPVDEAVALAKQIAEGLEDAHEHGIVHRDLKPANIKLTPGGKVKILDFGLAKALEGDPTSSPANSQLSHSPTMSRHMTEAGMIMGTAAYMSPEQARGKTVDKRADIWSFGVVLFEMLTGTRLFAGETVSDTLASVLREEVPWDRLPKDTPPHVTLVLKRCLTRDTHDRLRDIGDARLALMGAFETLAPQTATAAAAMPRGRMQWAAFAFGVVALLSLGVAAALYFRPPSASDTPTRLSVMTPANRPIALGWSPGGSLALSPDGTHVVYVGTDLEAPANRPGGSTQLQVRSLATLAGRDGRFEPLGPPPGNFDVPRVSPDGRSVAYVVKGEVYVYDLARGSTTKLTQDGQDSGPAWRPDGRSLAISSRRKDVNGIFLKNLDGTERLLVPLPASAERFRQSSWGPDGMRLAYTVQNGSLHDIWILTMGDKPTSEPFLQSAAAEHSPAFSPDGRWLAYVSDESGRSEVYVRGYPQGDRFAVSASGGNGPVWARDGKALFFEGNIDGAPKLMTASVTRDGVSLRVGKPLPLLDRRVPGPTGVIEQYAGSGNGGVRYDILPDGRFVMIRGPDPNAAREIVVVQHWFEELKRLVPTR